MFISFNFTIVPFTVLWVLIEQIIINLTAYVQVISKWNKAVYEVLISSASYLARYERSRVVLHPHSIQLMVL